MIETQTGYIYVLVDPRDGDRRYVGASKEPNSRLRSHINSPHSDALKEWINDLNQEGLEPKMDVLKEVDADRLAEKERKTIDSLSSESDLLNSNKDPRAKAHNDDDVVAAVRAHDPAATSEIADELGLSRQGTDRRLRSLRDAGRVSSKKIGASLVWFMPRDRAEADSGMSD